MHLRILFVDDDPFVLSALRRLFVCYHQEWEVEFAGGGSAALQLLAANPYDVVVSDMRMPEMTGAEFLNQVRQQYPRIVRIMLSGQTDRKCLFTGPGFAHQYLSKPCEADVLQRAITHTISVRNHLADSHLCELIAQFNRLPGPQGIVTQVLEAIDSPEMSLKEIAQAISSDGEMAGSFLELVNSSCLSCACRCVEVTDAISMVGIELTRPFLLLASLVGQLAIEKQGRQLKSLLSHSVAVARRAYAIAKSEHQNYEKCDHALLAGMLHDVGKLILADQLPDRFQEANSLADAANMPLWRAEYEVLHGTHAEVGAHLLGLWGVPNPIIEAVAFHHRPELSLENGFSPLVAVHAANFLEHAAHRANSEVRTAAQLFWESVGLSGKIAEWAKILPPSPESNIPAVSALPVQTGSVLS